MRIVNLGTSPFTRWVVAGLAIVVVAGVDYVTGVEVRVFPLYFAPISLVAWYGARRDALFAGVLCTLMWFGSNGLAGLRFASPGVWVANTLAQGSSFALVGLLIATLRAALLRERERSGTDPLTTLPNRRAFYEEGNRILALCRRKGRPVTMAYIDLDNFKTVNDMLGHEVGDQLLCDVARQLVAAIRPSDLPARLGGDEFAILFPEVDQRDGAVTLERLRFVLAGIHASNENAVTVSIGAVTFATVPEDMERMIRQADALMYEAKAAGKNRVRLGVAASPADATVPTG